VQDVLVSHRRPDIDVALAAAKVGAEVVRSAYGEKSTRHAKSGSDFATDADLDAERAILEVIESARPEDTRVGEESGRTGTSSTRQWLVDPLCGTLNFAAQTPLVAVNVALLDEEAGTVACVSADPIADELFWADSGGAFLRRDGADEALTPSPRSGLVDINCDGPADRPFLGPQLIADPAFRSAFGPRVTSTTLAVAWVAAGRRAGYVSDGLFVENVHYAAGTALCRRAGCVVTDLAGEPLEGGRGLVIAADVETHRQLVDIIRPHLADVLSRSS
jgi:myo-inositol-1(or 4)-monophosphatase